MNKEVREVRMLVDVIRAGFRGNCILNDSMRIQKLLKQFVSETQRDRVRVLELKLTLVSPSLAVDIYWPFPANHLPGRHFYTTTRSLITLYKMAGCFALYVDS